MPEQTPDGKSVRKIKFVMRHPDEFMEAAEAMLKSRRAGSKTSGEKATPSPDVSQGADDLSKPGNAKPPKKRMPGLKV